ncbi:11839_t:CDS:2, partial [Paraglomus brasilianum]
VPVTLYHPVFAKFVEQLSTIEITDQDCKPVLDAMSTSYSVEDKRNDMFRDWLSNYIGLPSAKLALPQTGFVVYFAGPTLGIGGVVPSQHIHLCISLIST